MPHFTQNSCSSRAKNSLIAKRQWRWKRRKRTRKRHRNLTPPPPCDIYVNSKATTTNNPPPLGQQLPTQFIYFLPSRVYNGCSSCSQFLETYLSTKLRLRVFPQHATKEYLVGVDATRRCRCSYSARLRYPWPPPPPPLLLLSATTTALLSVPPSSAWKLCYFVCVCWLCDVTQVSNVVV